MLDYNTMLSEIVFNCIFILFTNYAKMKAYRPSPESYFYDFKCDAYL